MDKYDSPLIQVQITLNGKRFATWLPECDIPGFNGETLKANIYAARPRGEDYLKEAIPYLLLPEKEKEYDIGDSLDRQNKFLMDYDNNHPMCAGGRGCKDKHEHPTEEEKSR